jgi:hypothetical protein
MSAPVTPSDAKLVPEFTLHPEFLPYVGFVLTVFSAAFVVSGVLLGVACVPSGLASAIACSYPYVLVGNFTILLAALLLIGAVNAFARYGMHREWVTFSVERLNGVLLLFIFASVLLFFLFGLQVL